MHQHPNHVHCPYACPPTPARPLAPFPKLMSHPLQLVEGSSPSWCVFSPLSRALQPASMAGIAATHTSVRPLTCAFMPARPLTLPSARLLPRPSAHLPIRSPAHPHTYPIPARTPIRPPTCTQTHPLARSPVRLHAQVHAHPLAHSPIRLHARVHAPPLAPPPTRARDLPHIHTRWRECNSNATAT
jgi:hypothetical protein